MICELQGDGLPVALVCETLDVSRSGYYDFRQGYVSERQWEDNRLKPKIRKIFWEHKRRYGARRISKELAAKGEICGPRRVGRLMHEMGLVAIQPKAFRPRTTDSTHTLGYSPNLLLNAEEPTAINQLWVGDITYVPLTHSRFAYAALLMDRFSRRIVGWDVQLHMQEALVLAALQRAIRTRHPRVGMIHHTDRGGQYAGNEYRRVLQGGGMLQSMSRAANCYDNAFMESCFGTIKTELEMQHYANVEIARKEVAAYIRYYNTRRRHSSLDYAIPSQFEMTM